VEGLRAIVDQVAVVELTPGSAEHDLVEARRRLLATPGLGAVVLADAAAVVTYRRFVGHDPSLDHDWVVSLVKELRGRSYEVEADGLRVPHPRVSLARRLYRWLRLRPQVRVLRLRHARRRWVFLARLHYAAWIAGGRVRADVAKDVGLGRGIRFDVRPGTSSLTIAQGCVLGDAVTLRLGGVAELGRGVHLRDDVTLNVKGHLELRGRNVLGRGAMVHVDGRMVWEWGASCSEYATILDSHHEFDGTTVHVHDQGVAASDVWIGAASLVGAHAAVLPGVRIGRACLVGTQSVVTKDVPDRHLAVGVPARVRPLPGLPSSEG